MDQYCPVVHKSRRPQARLQTAKLFYKNRRCPKSQQVQSVESNVERKEWAGPPYPHTPPTLLRPLS
jgi:hypothetical protein